VPLIASFVRPLVQALGEEAWLDGQGLEALDRQQHAEAPEAAATHMRHLRQGALLQGGGRGPREEPQGGRGVGEAGRRGLHQVQAEAHEVQALPGDRRGQARQEPRLQLGQVQLQPVRVHLRGRAPAAGPPRDPRPVQAQAGGRGLGASRQEQRHPQGAAARRRRPGEQRPQGNGVKATRVIELCPRSWPIYGPRGLIW
jgi:hypothetical protein